MPNKDNPKVMLGLMENVSLIEPKAKPDSFKAEKIKESLDTLKKYKNLLEDDYVKKELEKKYSNLMGKKNKTYGLIKGE